jgi:EAL domain-containing protein (putative c-di-GMP-specific phosphodiesterase class I)
VVASSKDAAIIETLTALGAHGVNLDLDDFGVGQASLAAIRRFGVSRIKIDRSFVIGLDEDPEQRSMVAAIIAMARQLGVETLAEGVETDAVRAILTEMGCDHLQGYLLARPMPVDETLSWATRHIASQPEPPRVGRRAG